MTARTIAPGAGPALARRHVPWPKLAWVTQRQRRGAIIGTSVLLGVFAVYLVIMAVIQNNAYTAVTACHPAGALKCQQLAQVFSRDYWGGNSSAVLSGGAQTVSSLMYALPVLLGMFLGAPALARELETGTFRFAWTQGAGRTRWTVSTLVVPALLLVAATGAFTAIFYWYFRPFLADGQVSEMLPLGFPLLGVAFAAWTLLAYAVAAFLGALFRRTIPAMAVTLVVYIALAMETAIAIRPHYAAPLTVQGWNNAGGAGWVIGSWVRAPNGQVLSRSAQDGLYQHLPSSVQNSSSPDALTTWLTQHGYTMWQSVQPDSRFWQFQLTEGAWLLVVSSLLIAATVWLVRRRGALRVSLAWRARRARSARRRASARFASATAWIISGYVMTAPSESFVSLSLVGLGRNRRTHRLPADDFRPLVTSQLDGARPVGGGCDIVDTLWWTMSHRPRWGGLG